MTRTLLTLAVFFATAAPLLAAPRPGNGLEYTPPAPPAPPDITGLIVRLVVMTAGLVALCVLVVWLARRANRPVDLKGNADSRLRHEGTLPLDRNCAVHLLTADGQTVAVTTDATGLRSIVVLSEPFESALAEAQAPAAPEATPTAPAPAPPAPAWSADDVRQLLQRLVRRGDRPGVHLEPPLRDDQP